MTLKPNSITILVDTREQRPWQFPHCFMTESATLATGDYSVKGLTDEVAIERKSLADLLACVGRERDRFEREVHRLLAPDRRGFSASTDSRSSCAEAVIARPGSNMTTASSSAGSRLASSGPTASA